MAAATPFRRSFRAATITAAGLVAALLLPATVGAVSPTTPGAVHQLSGRAGCHVDGSARRSGCTAARALQGPAPFTGSHAVTVTPDGRNVYVAASTSNAVTEFQRSPRNGALTQPKGTAGCVAVGGSNGCARGVALRKPVSVAASPDGNNVYVAAMQASAVITFARKRGVLRQTGCVAAVALPGCSTAPALLGADVVVVSPDGNNVYAGAFGQAAVQGFSRDSSTGALTPSSCIGEGIAGCAAGALLDGPEGMAISGDGNNVYVGAAIANAVVVLDRDASTGALTQAPAPNGCMTLGVASGCTQVQAVQGADAVAVTADGTNVYVASGLQNGFAAFSRGTESGTLTQLQNTAGCFLAAIAQACGLGRAFATPEGVAVSPDDDDVYVGAFGSSAVDSFTRDASGGALTQLRGRDGCTILQPYPTCRTGRALGQANAVAVSPDGQNLYVGAFSSNALSVFRRTT